MSGASAEAARIRQLRTLVLFGGAIGASWMLATWIVGASSPTLSFAGLGLVVGAIVLASLVNWRSGLYLFLAWLLFEDLARKHMGNNMAIYFGKDVLVGVTYVLVLFAVWRGEVKRFRPPFWLPLALFFWLGVLQLFNPSSPSLFYGLLGLKLYFYYIPLMFVGYALLRSTNDVNKFLMVNLALAGVIAFLGVTQAIVGLDFLNPTELAPDIAQLGRYTRYTPLTGVAVSRPSSVFVSDGRFASYLAMIWVFGLGAAGYLLQRDRRYRRVVLASMSFVFMGIVLSGSRGAFMYTLASSLVLVGAFLWGSPFSWAGGRRRSRAIYTAFGIAGIALLIVILIFPGAVGARWTLYSETLSPVSPRFELVGRAWNYPIANFMQVFDYPNWPLGYGIGTASLGGQYVARILRVPPSNIGVESGFSTLLLEMGVLGLVLWLIWTTVLVCSAWRIVRKLRGTPAFPIGFSIFWFASLLLFPFTYAGLASYQNFVLNAYVWLLLGILYRLPELQAQEQLRTPVNSQTVTHAR